jgi:hypothetical protein
MDIRINFINQSNDQSNSNVIIFQKNIASNFDEIAIAWQVIKNCGQNWSHEFVYPMSFNVGTSDSYGNLSNLEAAANGQKWDVIRSASGDVLVMDNNSSASPSEVEIMNKLPNGSINAHIYKGGKLLASKTGVSPQQKAIFQFNPTLWVGVVPQVEEGETMNSAILSNINTEISLMGISSADLIMTGGGTGPNAMPFTFTLNPK